MTDAGRIDRVEEGSQAQEVGIRPGDSLISVNGLQIRDVVDFRFATADDDLTLLVNRDGRKRSFRIDQEYGKQLGVIFEEPLFDGIRRCDNRCIFCFINQLPEGLRPSLYVRDDDYRLSFLHGSYITLTNLTEQDWERIGEQRISPLYVSVHATHPEIRAKLLGASNPPNIIHQLERLKELGIEVHAQVVLCPGLNDGQILADTVRDLSLLYPSVRSVAVVPWGVTRYNRVSLRPVTPGQACRTVMRVIPWQESYRSRLGVGFVYLADEFYLSAELPIPDADHYDDFPQLEDGVGMARQLLDLWERVRKRAHGVRQQYDKVTLVTGTLMGSIMEDIGRELGQLEHLSVDVVPVTNRFFGPSITVSGLLLARDVMETLRNRGVGDVVVLPRNMFDADGLITLDDVSREEMEEQLGVPVRVAETIDEIVYMGGLSVG
jgi:putative radical SAM enzyme (TIGR03279 family)